MKREEISNKFPQNIENVSKMSAKMSEKCHQNVTKMS